MGQRVKQKGTKVGKIGFETNTPKKLCQRRDLNSFQHFFLLVSIGRNSTEKVSQSKGHKKVKLDLLYSKAHLTGSNRTGPANPANGC